jgi:DNA replication protein DnaC
MCHDTGWVYLNVPVGHPDFGKARRCKCRERGDAAERERRLYERCNLPQAASRKTLETFKTYGDPLLSEAWNLCRDMADGGDETVFLTLVGEVDRGKSHLAVGTCRQWLARRQSACYANVPRVLNELRDGFNREGEDSFRSRLNFYCRVGLLTLDDLGTEKVTQWGAEQLQTIINARYDDMLHTIVTTNRPMDDLFGYGDFRDSWRELANMRVASRLQREAWCHVVVLDTEAHVERGQ